MVVVKKLDVFHILKLVTTFAIFLCFLAYGIAVNLFGPTWLDLKLLVGTSLERMSFSISMRSASFSVGALIGGFIFNYLNRQVMYSILLFILGIATVLLSLIPDYVIFLVLNCVFGLVSGAADTAVNVWILDMWQDKSGPFLQALQFCWAVGFILAPLISHPFLAEENNGVVDAHGFVSAGQLNETELILGDNSTTLHDSRLYYPYGIAGSLVCFGSILIMFLFFYEKKLVNQKKAEREKDAEKCEPLKTEKELQLEAEAEEKPNKVFIVLIVLLSCIMVCFFCASEMTTFQYLPTFVVHLGLGLSKFTGSFILSALAISFTVGRFSGILLAIKLKPEYILFLDWIIMFAGNVILLFSVNSESLLWVGSVVLGFGFAAFFPAVFSFLKNRLDVTNIISAMLLLSSLAGNACGFPVVIGKYIESSPLILIYGNFLCVLIIGITFIALTFIEFKFVRKNKK